MDAMHESPRRPLTITPERQFAQDARRLHVEAMHAPSREALMRVLRGLADAAECFADAKEQERR